MNTESHSQLAAFIWSVADLLRGDFRQSQYGRIILPFTLLRRLECVLEPTKDAVLREAHAHQAKPEAVREKLLLRAADQPFFERLAADPRHALRRPAVWRALRLHALQPSVRGGVKEGKEGDHRRA
ncbi:type I restriction-modification system subunit M N-terminal domain-containing protein [Halomonas sp. THAF12]|uniref:type I restriction-modification system subunit M N-terminal domain-containing protein n=1 Tax=Halomonas sp. B23F22_10 TaxID=3459515 RepID=UPI00373DFAA8